MFRLKKKYEKSNVFDNEEEVVFKSQTLQVRYLIYNLNFVIGNRNCGYN